MEGIFEHGKSYFIEVVAGMHDSIKCDAIFNEVDNRFETEHFNVGIASCKVLNLSDLSDDDDKIYSCNGCGVKMAYEDIAYENTDQGDNYCSDCHEAIQGDPESAAGLKDEPHPNPYHHGKAIYKGNEFPEYVGQTVDLYDDHSNPNAPCYQIKFPGSDEMIGNMHDEDITF